MSGGTSDAGTGGRIVSLTGVYHANGSLTGELSYWIGARLGRRHCALCDITHGRFREKPGFARCRDGLLVPFEAVHLDERPPDIVEMTEGRTPCVVARIETTGGASHPVLLVDLETLEGCDGDPEAFIAALEAAVDAAGLTWG